MGKKTKYREGQNPCNGEQGKLTRVDKVKAWSENHRVISILIVCVAVVGPVVTLFDFSDKIFKAFRPPQAAVPLKEDSATRHQVGQDSVTIGEVLGPVGDRSVVIRLSDTNKNIMITNPMAVGFNAHAGPGSMAIGANARAGIQTVINTAYPSNEMREMQMNSRESIAILKQMQRELANAARSQNEIRSEEFRRKYPQGYILFSVTETFVSEEMRNWETNRFKVDWSAASVKSLTPQEVVFVPPAFHVGKGEVKKQPGITFSGGKEFFELNFGGHDVVSLGRRTGETARWASIGLGVNTTDNVSTNLKVLLEVATNNSMGVTMVMGIKTVVEPLGRPKEFYMIGFEWQ